MAVCTGCEQSFPRLDPTRCSKCLARKPGLSLPEIETLNSRPQCAGCGVMSNRLSGLCNGCIKFCRFASAIPREFMTNPRILELLNSDEASDAGIHDTVANLSSTSNSILSAAVSHQESASESRIGVQVRRGSVKSDAGGLSRFKGLQKSAASGSGSVSILAERKAKKADWIQQQATTGPKFAITLWRSRGVEEKPKQVMGIHCARVYETATPMKQVLDDLLGRLNMDFQSLLGIEFEILWSQITMFAHESATVGVSIEYLRADEQLKVATAGSWLKEFTAQRLCAKSSLQAGILNIRFVIEETLMPDTDDQGRNNSLASRRPGNSAKLSTALISKRKRADSASPLLSKRPNSRTSGTHGFREPGLPASVTRGMAGSSNLLSSAQATSRQPRVLKSAFRIPAVPSSQWSREVSLADYKFTRSTAEYQPSGDVNISRVEGLEIISIAEDWVKGEELSMTRKHYETGFIGCGFTKRAIYARYNDKEYVITQPSDDTMSFSAVREVLIAELKLLAQCDGIKQKFDEFIQDGSVEGVPAFYFNFKDSFYGEIEPLSASGRRTMPHIGFLATPLLPCGRYDDPIRKFTGSDNLGPAKDSLTQAIHAFVHFAWIYSREQVLFCDMQGTRDHKKKMCLIDPQAHTMNPRNEGTIYWDGGAMKIAAWKEQHLTVGSDIREDGLCEDNWVCGALELSNLQMEDLDDEGEPKSPASRAEKSKLGYVLNE